MTSDWNWDLILSGYRYEGYRQSIGPGNASPDQIKAEDNYLDQIRKKLIDRL